MSITKLFHRAATEASCPACGGTGCKPNQRVLGDLLRERRYKASVTQRVLALRFGHHQTYIARLEHGTRPWTTRLAQRYLAALRPSPIDAKGTKCE